MSTKLSKAEEYRRLANEATAQAEAAGLDNVREKHEAAALQWMALAAVQEQVRYAAPNREHRMEGFAPDAEAPFEGALPTPGAHELSGLIREPA
jgi:hypothetical protein